MEGLVAPIASAAVGGGSDDPDDVGVVQRLIAAYISSLEKAMILNWIFIGLWGEFISSSASSDSRSLSRLECDATY